MIESWGRGIEKIQNACDEWKIPFPAYTVHPNDIMIMFENDEYLRLFDDYKNNDNKPAINRR